MKWGLSNCQTDDLVDNTVLESVIEAGPTEQEEEGEQDKISIRLPDRKKLMMEMIHRHYSSNNKRYSFSLVGKLIVKTGLVRMEMNVQPVTKTVQVLRQKNELNISCHRGLSRGGPRHDRVMPFRFSESRRDCAPTSVYVFRWCTPVVARLMSTLSLGSVSDVVELALSEAFISSNVLIDERAKTSYLDETVQLDKHLAEVASSELATAISLQRSGLDVVDKCESEVCELLKCISEGVFGRAYGFPSGTFYGVHP